MIKRNYYKYIWVSIMIALSLLRGDNIAFADGVTGYSNDTNIWIDVVEIDPNTQISVTVPVSFAFVVKGTSDDTSNITSDDLLLPHATITVPDGGGKYQLGFGDNTAYCTLANYSTTMKVDQTDPTVRQGLSVKVNARIENSKEAENERKYWLVKDEQEIEAINNAAGMGSECSFKLYALTLTDSFTDPIKTYKFENPKEKSLNPDKSSIEKIYSVYLADKDILDSDISSDNTKDARDDELEKCIALPAPTSTQYDEKGLAVEPYYLNLNYELTVGGRRCDYKQIEGSAKIATIIWDIYSDTVPENNN